MKLAPTSAILLAAMLASSCTPKVAAIPATQTQAHGDCPNPESGIIRPESPGLPEMTLSGPFVVKMLQSRVDPANPHNGAIFISLGDNSAITLADFKGPLYLAEGEKLFAKTEFLSMGAIYSGCRPD